MSTQATKELTGLALDHRMPKIGQAVAQRYEVQEVLGIGGFAVVYRARDIKLGGEVALKVLEPDKSASPDFVTRFQQEINLVRQLRHHNTIKIWDAGLTETNCLYMASELVDGEELSDLIRRTRGLEVARVKRIVTQVLRSLAEAHKAGIIHRDLKPSNIMIAQLEGEPDYVKVVDFGIAKALDPGLSMVKTQTGLVMCTPAYASPEVLRNQGVAPASDLYALGLIMIELLSGFQAVQGESQVDIMVKQINPAPVEIPAALANTPIGAVIARAVAKQAEHRYQSAGEMLKDLERVPDHAVPPMGPPQTGPVGPAPPTPVSGQAHFPGAATAAGVSSLPPPHSAALGTADTLLASNVAGAQTAGVSKPAGGGAKVAWIVALIALIAVGGLTLVLISRDKEPAGSAPGAGVTEGSGEERPAVGDPAGAPAIAQNAPGSTAGAQTTGPAGADPTPGSAPPSGLNTIDPTALAQTSPGQTVPGATSGPGVTTPTAPGTVEPGTVTTPGTVVPTTVAPTTVAPTTVATPDTVAPGTVTTPAAVEPGTVALGTPTTPGTVAPGTVTTPGTVAPGTVIGPGSAVPAQWPGPAGTPATPLPEGAAPMFQGALASAANPTATVGPITYNITGSPRRVRLYWRYADDPDDGWSDRVRCSRPCTLEVPEVRPIEVRLRKTNHCTEEFTLAPDPAHGPWELDLEEGCGRPSSSSNAPIVCTNTCQYAFDGECDDGGPRSLYALCPLGTDCGDCGPRSLGRQ